MKRTQLIFALTVFGATLGVAQTTDRTADNSYSRQENESGGHNWGWIGLLGLGGLAGLRRGKSEDDPAVVAGWLLRTVLHEL
jgi:MYXO-CTERM domain-containing protein